MSQTIQFRVHYLSSGPFETRIFSAEFDLDDDFFLQFNSMLTSEFPDLRGKQFELFVRDEQGDLIQIRNEDEFTKPLNDDQMHRKVFYVCLKTAESVWFDDDIELNRETFLQDSELISRFRAPTSLV